MSTEQSFAPDKLPAARIFTLLDGAPFGRLATYTPPSGGRPGHCYVVPLQFLHRNGLIYLITTPGRKLRNLRAAPQGVCFQLDLTEGSGWSSICTWGDYEDVRGLSERVSVVSASFNKYPDRTTRQAVAWLRQHRPRLGSAADPAREMVVGRIRMKSVSGRFWPGLLLSAGPRLVRPAPAGPAGTPTSHLRRAHPTRLSADACRAVLDARPLARLGCYDPARERNYCLPLWFMLEGGDLWFYHPGGGQALAAALHKHPRGVCAQVDDLDCSPAADPSQPWRSVLAEGDAEVFPLGVGDALDPNRQAAILRRIRARLQAFEIRSVFVPPDPDLAPPRGFLLRLHMQTLGGQATGDAL